MTILVSFHGMQRRLTQKAQIHVPLKTEMRVLDVLVYVKEIYPELPLSADTVLVTVNRRVASLEQLLQINDDICFLPHIGGG